jgi:RNA polymerase sigma-B factor
MPAERHGAEGRSATAKLLRDFHKRGDSAARQRLIELYLPLVDSFARRYSRSSDEYDDLNQVGCIGLINAIDRFDLEQGDELTAFAVPNITGEIRRHLRDRSPAVRLPRPVLELRGAAIRTQADLAASLGRTPTNAEIAERLDAGVEDVAAALEAGRASMAVELAPDAGAEAPRDAESLDAAEDRLFLSGAFGHLDERERRILYLRYVRDLDPNDIARELAMSRRQLSRTTQAALAKLRLGLESPSLASPAGGPTMAAKGAGNDLELDSYIRQPYHIELVKDDAGDGWTAQVEELHGCAANGATADEAVGRVEAAMRDWVTDALANGREVPKPRSATSHSGRLLVRMPQSLHAELSRAAEREEVSLNQFITSSLASAVGWRRDERAEPGGAPDSGARLPPAGDGRSFALVANLVILALVAVIAVILLVVALRRGF